MAPSFQYLSDRVSAAPHLDPDAFQKVLDRALASIIARAQVVEPAAGGIPMGLHDVPERFVIWITAPTDAERDRLAAHPNLAAQFREILALEGYPAEAVPFVLFGFASQETVDRDFEGSWISFCK